MAASIPKNTDKEAWGPQLWHSMHMIALNYPDKPSPSDKLNYKIFFESLKDVIPCLSCADNYAEHLQELPIDRHLDSARSLFTWTVKVHNIVNASRGKRTWAVEEAIAYYSAYTMQGAASGASSGRGGSGDNIASSSGGAGMGQGVAHQQSAYYVQTRDTLIKGIVISGAALVVMVVLFLAVRHAMKKGYKR
jgi:Erv1 / Alr family